MPLLYGRCIEFTLNPGLMSIHFLKRNFIPKHPTDLDAIAELENTSWQILEPYAMELLEWLQDLSWAVAPPILKYLQPHILQIEQELIQILKSDASQWKYNLVHTLLMELELNERSPKIQQSLAQLAYRPSLSDQQTQVDRLAQELLEASTDTAYQSIRFELVGSSPSALEKIWTELKQALPSIQQLSLQIGQYANNEDFSQLLQDKTQLLEALYHLQTQYAEQLLGFQSRYC